MSSLRKEAKFYLSMCISRVLGTCRLVTVGLAVSQVFPKATLALGKTNT